MKLPNKGRGITLATLVLALGAAVYMNWAFAKQTPPTAQADQGQEAVETSASDGAVPVLEPFSAETAAPESGKNYGEAQLVSATVLFYAITGFRASASFSFSFSASARSLPSVV